ncbi:MAG: hypothetical protein LRY31_01045 [Burkholderiaceae bacterium]|nr:hypothetical protein [Burkholderiaceae bacterium]
MTHDGKTEIRIELQSSEVSVLDGYCHATGRSRTDVMRQMLKDWSEQRLHESTVICRVAGINPFATDISRQQSGEI